MSDGDAVADEGGSMTDLSVEKSIFERLGVARVINACGVYTDLGGSVPSPGVRAAMDEVGRYYVSMPELLDSTGKMLADLVGAEAARVTTGAAAAIALGVAACMTGVDGELWERLPNAEGMKNEVLVQHRHHFKYDRCARIPGATVRRVGTSEGTTEEHLHAAIGERTAAILFPAHLGGRPNTVPLARVSSISRERGVPLIVDAAYQNYPTSIMSTFTRDGADLVCFSAKYYGGPNSGGFICGRRDLIDAIAGLDFTRYESGAYRTFGRPFKLDRQTVVGVVVALQEWLSMDHAARWAGYDCKVRAIFGRVAGAEGISARPMCFTMEENLVPEPVNCLAITFKPGCRKSARSVADALAAGDPSVRTVELGDVLVVAVDTVLDGQEVVIGERLRQALS
jgi:L-seryl-tRNA(Ser) seleniumtransferase